MKCPQCGTDNPAGMRFCGQCATALPQKLTCPNCGVENPAGMKFCGQCATALDPPDRPAQKPQPAPPPPKPEPEPEPDVEQTLYSAPPPKPSPEPVPPKPAAPAAADTIVKKTQLPLCNCPVCGAKNIATAQFCTRCRAPMVEKPAETPPTPTPPAQPEPPATKPCPACGYTNKPDIRFCEQCAAPLEAKPARPASTPPAKQVCAACGHANQPGLRFCEQCAAPLTAPRPAWYTRRPVQIGGAALLALVVVVAVFLFMTASGQLSNISGQSSVSDEREALRQAETIKQTLPEQIEATPVIKTFETDGNNVYGIEYLTEETIQTDNGPVSVKRGTVIVVDGETGQVQTLHLHTAE